MKFLQLFQIGKDSKTMYPDWIRYKQQERGHSVMRTSIPYNWIILFNGNMGWTTRADATEVELDTGRLVGLNDFDLIHVHLTGEHLNLIQKIKKYTKAKVVASIDYGLRLWGEVLGFNCIESICSALAPADYIFSVEPEMAWVLQEGLGRDVPCIPHPVNVKATAKFKTGFSEPKTCVVMIHQYDNEWYLPHLVLHDLPIRLRAFGIGAERIFTKANGVLYNDVYPYSSFESLINPAVNNFDLKLEGGALARAYLAYDSYGLKIAGRFQTDLAALGGIPCIGSDIQYFQRVLYPETTTGFYEINKQRELAKRLLTDLEFYQEVSENAERRIIQYDMDHTKDNFINWIEGKDFIDWKLVCLANGGELDV